MSCLQKIIKWKYLQIVLNNNRVPPNAFSSQEKSEMNKLHCYELLDNS